MQLKDLRPPSPTSTEGCTALIVISAIVLLALMHKGFPGAH